MEQEKLYYKRLIFKSYFDYFKNGIIMTTRNRFGIFLSFFKILIFLILIFYLFIYDGYFAGYYTLEDLMLFVLIFIFLISAHFLRYVFIIKKFLPDFFVEKIKLNNDEIIFYEKNNGEEIFVKYEDINSMEYKFNPFNHLYIDNNIPINFFMIKDKNNKIFGIPLNIKNIYEALDIIVAHIPDYKRSNIRIINGRVTASFDSKTNFSGMEINLETVKGKIFLIIFAIIVMGFWIYIGFFFKV